jgi:Na+-transporting NADH:ubiquinone oxidoreductase subunit C
MFQDRVNILFLESSGEPVDGTELDQDGDGDLDIEDYEIAVDEAEESGSSPELLAVYERKDGGRTTAVALPMSGNGLWGPLSGYVALDAGKKEVVGTTFFAPKETPGLGAEIQEPPFEQQWVGKSIRGSGGDVATIRVVKGEAKTLCPDDLAHCVDGVSGATITSRGVDAMIAQTLDWYEPFLSSKQGGQ